MSVWKETKQVLKEMAQTPAKLVKEFKAKSARNKVISAGSYLADVAILGGVFVGFVTVTATLPLVGIFVAGVAASVANAAASKKLQSLPSRTDNAVEASSVAPAAVAEAAVTQVQSPAAEFNTEAAPAQETAAAPVVETKPQPPAAG